MRATFTLLAVLVGLVVPELAQGGLKDPGPAASNENPPPSAAVTALRMAAREGASISGNEDVWVRLTDETARHLQQARKAFLAGEPEKSAAQLRKAAAFVRLEAGQANLGTAEQLLALAEQLDQLAERVETRAAVSPEQFDAAAAGAYQILAKHYTEQAYVSLSTQDPQPAGSYLKAAKKYLQDAAQSARIDLAQWLRGAGSGVEVVAKKLIAGEKVAAEEADQVAQALARQIQLVGKQVRQEEPGRSEPSRAPTIVRRAVCSVHPLGGGKVSGTVTFLQRGPAVEISAVITGLTPGEHGFHVHEYGDCTAPDGSSAGGHYNPTGMPHGGPDSPERHVGDLGNLVANADGTAVYQRTDRVIQLVGPYSIIGRAIIVHAGRDDLTSQPSGNAGPRIACGVIGIAHPPKDE